MQCDFINLRIQAIFRIEVLTMKRKLKKIHLGNDNKRRTFTYNIFFRQRKVRADILLLLLFIHTF